MEIKDVNMFELEKQRYEAIKNTGKYIELNVLIGEEDDVSSEKSVGKKYPIVKTTMIDCGEKEVARLYATLQGVIEQLEKDYPIACVLSKLTMKIRHVNTLETEINSEDEKED